MIIKSIQEIEVNDPRINISVDLKTQTSTIILSYTCPSCAGHGCRREGRCNNTGSMSMDLNPSKIDLSLDTETASKLRLIIQKLSSSMTKDHVCIPTPVKVE